MTGKSLVKEKLTAAGLPVPFLLQELGLKQERTFWRQLETGTMTAARISRFVSLLNLRPAEARQLIS